MIRKIFICAFFVTIAFFEAYAQEPPIEMTPDAALKTAWERNGEIKSARLKYESSIYDVKSAGSLSNPQLTVSPKIVGEEGADSVIEFSQKLEVTGSRTTRKHQASAKSDEEKASFLSTINDISLKTEEAYWELAKASFLLAYNRENLVYFETLKNKIEKQIELGALPKFHSSRAEIELSKARQELSLSEFEFKRCSAQFNKLLGFESSKEIKLVYEIELFPNIDKEEALQLAMAGHPDILSAQAKIKSAKMKERSAKISRLPDLELTARKSEWNSKGGASIAVSFPILDWGSVSNEIKSAQKQAQSEEEMLIFVTQNIKSDLEVSVSEFETAMKIIDEYKNGIMDRAENLSILVEKAYEKGAGGFLDLIDARRNFAQTRVQRVEALINGHKSLARLKHSYAQFSAMEADYEKK